MPFQDRIDAGRQLAEALTHYRDAPGLIVLGLARGGVPVAAEVARDLGAPLDVAVARKIGAPGQPEFGIGAIAPPGERFLDERSVKLLGITHEELDQVIVDETQEMERRLLLYRGDSRLPDVAGRTVILVDDGLATGVTARAMLRALRKQEPAKLVFAAPVCAHDSAEVLRGEADDVVCVEAPRDFRAVGFWYSDFSQTEDAEVMRLLGREPAGEPDREARREA